MIDTDYPFWREDALCSREFELLDALMEAHEISALRDNISTHAVIGAAIGGGDYLKAMVAPLMTLGGLHAPLSQVMKFLEEVESSGDVFRIIESGAKVPGWGTSFIKGMRDPDWDRVGAMIHELDPELWMTMDMVTNALHSCGKMIYPNPGGFTGAAAMVLDMPSACAPYLFLAGRLETWSKQFLKHSSAGKVWQP